MKKFILLILCFFIGNGCFAFDIVYPKKNEVTINANSTFFIGSSNKPLKINGQNVTIHSSGGFAHVVPLQEGQNIFVLQSDDEKKVFVITKPKIQANCNLPVKFVKYSENRSFYVTTEGAPLRSTPVDGGINRIAHLQRNIQLIADGEQGGFYRVLLGNDKYGWIAKTNVKSFCEYDVELASLSGYDYIDSEDFFTFIFHLDKRVPFEMLEGEPFLMKFYNVKNNPDNTYVMDFPVNEALNGHSLVGYSGYYEGNDFVLKIRKPLSVNSKKPLKNILIAVDAGHGGYENGAIGCLGDKEKDITLSISKYLQTELKKRGAKVYMTREDDIYTGLKDRVENANRENAVVLLSIHANALPDGADPNKNSGVNIYYYYNQAKPLAQTLIDTITSEMGINNDKVRQGSLALVRNTNALSLLIETAYLINPEDNAKLINPEFQYNYARAIADGLEKYFIIESKTDGHIYNKKFLYHKDMI